MPARLVLVLVTLALSLVTLAGCSGEPDPKEDLGVLDVPLSVDSGGVTYRFLGTINVLRRGNGAVAATIVADAQSPSTHTLKLAPGNYTVEVVSGYSCTVTPADATFTGCTYAGAQPNPFVVTAAKSTTIVLSFTFHFDQNVGVVFRTGGAIITLAPIVETPCGVNGCPSGELCVSIDGGGPSCAAECTTDADCGAGEACFALDGSTQSVCASVVPTLWARQFGTGDYDGAAAVATDTTGNVIVAGYVTGALSGQSSAGASDAFVRKLDADGNELWTRLIGTSSYDLAYTVATDVAGNIVVAGYAGGALSGQSSAGASDAFVRKLDADGNELWTRQFGTSNYDEVYSVAIDAAGNIVMAGYTLGTLAGQSSAGSTDGFVGKLDPDGNDLWMQQFGSSTYDLAKSVGVDSAGNVVVVGYTEGTLPGQIGAGPADGFVRKLDADGNELWTKQFGGAGYDTTESVSVDIAGNVVVAGYTYGALPGQTSAGSVDAFVRKQDADGNELWTKQFGTTSNDYVFSVATDVVGSVVVTGQTFGTLSGQGNAGSPDAFVRKQDADGNELWTKQFGTGDHEAGISVATDVAENTLVAGSTYGTFSGQSSAGYSDAFVMKLGP